MDDYEIDREKWKEPKPFGFSGLFRIRNDDEFMEVAVRSHLPWLDEAVLVIQPSDDKTYEIAYRLEEEEPKIRVCEYPFVVDWTGSPGMYKKNPAKVGHAVHMSNWGMSQCRYSWVVKTEADVIALSSFEKVVERIKCAPEKWLYYGRAILNIAGWNCDQISMTNPRNAGWDECVVPNRPKYGFRLMGRFAMIPVEQPRVCMGWSALHTKRCKARFVNKINKREEWAPWTEENVQKALRRHNGGRSYPGIDSALGEACLYEREWINYYLEHRGDGRPV